MSAAPSVSSPPTPTGSADIIPWGPPSAGKTTLLAAIVHTLRTRVNNPREGRFYDVFPEDEGAVTFLTKDVEALASNGQLPLATPPKTPSATFLMGFRDKGDGTTGHFHRLLLMDAAGEATNPRSDSKSEYWKRVRQAKGVLMVINGVEAKKPIQYGSNESPNTTDYAGLIRDFIIKAQDNSKIKPYVAICLSMADKAFDTPEEAHRKNTTEHNTVERFLHIVGQDAYSNLMQYIGERHFKIFITSACGWCRDDDEQWKPNISEDNSKLLVTGDSWRTIGAIYPLMWLFDKIEDDLYANARSGWLHTLLNTRRRYREKHLSNQDILKTIIQRQEDYEFWL